MAVAVATLGLLVALAAPAAAHIDPDPTSAAAGQPATITFNVEHGCGDSPTTKLEMQLPSGLTGTHASTTNPGWTAVVTGNTVVWQGPAQAPHTPFDIAVQATMPTKPGRITFPILQTCQQGTVSWIELQQPGQPEPDHPAPAVDIVASGAAASTTTVAASSHSTSAAPRASKPASTSGGGNNNAGVIAGIVVAVIIVGGAAGLFVIRRRHTA
jgi:uncharacterized protein YcnI